MEKPAAMMRISTRLRSLLALALALPLTSMGISAAQAAPARVNAFMSAPGSVGMRVATPPPLLTTRKTGRLTGSRPGSHTFRFQLLATANADASTLTRTAPISQASKRPVLASTVPKLTHTTDKTVISGKKWKTVGTVALANTKRLAGFRLRVPRKAGNHTYRVRSGATRLTKASNSARFALHQTDAKKHAVYLANAKRYMKMYCPSTPIYIDSPQVLSGPNLAGRASVSWRWTSGPQGSLTWDKSIHLVSGLSAKSLRVVAMHECAHIVQYRQLAKSPHAIDQAKKTATKVFKARRGDKGSGFERKAVHAWSKKKVNTFYTNTCSRAQLKSARTLLKEYGKRYQSASLTVAQRRRF